MNQRATNSVSQTNVQRTLLRLGLLSRGLVPAPMLTAAHRQQGLEFGGQYGKWTSTEWQQIAFSVESRFKFRRTDGRWHVRREKPMTANTLQPLLEGTRFTHHCGRHDGSTRVRIGPCGQCPPLYQLWFFSQDYFIYQQDNAKCHTAGSVRVGFEEPQEEFTVLPWPPNSPDLNPIENLWGHLDRIVHAMDLHPRNLAHLSMALESAWLSILVNTFRNLIDSHPARLAAVRFAKGKSVVVLNERKTTVRWIFDRWIQESTTDRSVRSHPPQCITSREDRQIVRIAVTDRSLTSRTVAQLTESVTHSVSARTILRRLQQSGLSARTPLLCLPLTQNHRCLLHQLCDERRISVAEWNEVVFTDESRISLQHHDGRIRVWRHSGERMQNSCVMHHHNGPAAGIMVWSGIGYHSRTPLVRIASTLNSQRYISEVLEPVVLPYLQGLVRTIFQQNNVLPHVARIVQRFFINHEIELLLWPARSPDLLPIENMVVYGCSSIDPDYTPNCHTRSTLVTRGSCLVCCTPRRHPNSRTMVASLATDSGRNHTSQKTATAGSDVVQSGRPIFDDFFQHLWPYIDNNRANVVFQMVKRLWLIRIEQ
ncbi:transposable element Tc3 transposase [Trichonephila clavipes]|nr:transposable element Tc3 transposase [Trichonephila clavipes]